MLTTDYTSKLLDLQDVQVEKVENFEGKQRIYIKLERKVVNCPCCREETSKIHDYRTQAIKDCEAFGRPVELVLRKRRYVCSACGKRFAEPNSFVPKYHRMTSRLVDQVIEKLSDERSFTSVARETGLSVTTVIRIFDHIHYPSMSSCPEVLAIDEFKGNTGGEKYNVILCDVKNLCVLDILPNRHENYLIDHFRKTDRSAVSYFVSDMWTPYRELSENFFSRSRFLVDRYHWMRQVTWAFEAIRKEEQKHLRADVRKHFKRSRSLLLKRYDLLTPEERQAVDTMLWYSARLREAHATKEWFYKVIDIKNACERKENFKEWVCAVSGSELVPFKKCAQTYSRWLTGILNSFDSPFTNGFTEGCNNKIKVLKRNAYGYRRFDRFRNRILHMFSHQTVA